MNIRLIFATILIMLLVSQQANAGRLTDAVAKLTEKIYADEIDDMDQHDVDDMVGVVEDVADDIVRSGDQNFRRHILDTWGAGKSETRRHIEKCPYCRTAAAEVAQQSGLPEPRDNIPRCFIINNAPYGAGNWGELYPLHPQTGEVMGAAQGYIWFQNGRYMGIDNLRRAFAASPCN